MSMSPEGGEFRVEHDSMGEVRVPAAARWGAQTQRAVENFPVSGLRLEAAHIRALGLIKSAAASVNAELAVLEPAMAQAIAQSADEVARGLWDAEFPIDVFQTGSGTSSNMNANEVIASLASERLGAEVHPNDHVNASQSSNDVFPSSIHLAATDAVVNDLIPALEHLAAALEAKRDEFASVVKAGRTHLMDATPVTLGQEFGGYAVQVRLGVERLRASLPRLAELPLGGTAVGTGINTPPGFAARVIDRLRTQTGLPLSEARDHFEAQGARDGLVEASGAAQPPGRALRGGGRERTLVRVEPGMPRARELLQLGLAERADRDRVLEHVRRQRARRDPDPARVARVVRDRLRERVARRADTVDDEPHAR